MIRFDHVTKVFPNGYVGLQDINFEIEPGDFTYVVGESGAGKTTLMRLLIREFVPTEGEIFLEDRPYSEILDKEIPQLRRKVGVVFQDYKLLPDRTVAENVGLALEILGVSRARIEEEVNEMLELVGLQDKANLFPVQLSGGELQRVAIARALAMTPTILFADEPTGNLDPETTKGIGQLLHKISELGTTVLVATHDTGLIASHPGRQLHLQKGKLVKDAPHPEKHKAKKEKEKTKEKEKAKKE